MLWCLNNYSICNLLCSHYNMFSCVWLFFARMFCEYIITLVVCQRVSHSTEDLIKVHWPFRRLIVSQYGISFYLYYTLYTQCNKVITPGIKKLSRFYCLKSYFYKYQTTYIRDICWNLYVFQGTRRSEASRTAEKTGPTRVVSFQDQTANRRLWNSSAEFCDKK